MELKVNGETVFAATGGRDFDPAKPCLVFLHGASFNRTVWNLQTRYFAWHGFGVMAVDLPGHGRSGGTALDNVPDLADWLIALLDAAGVDKATIVGHSLGALIAVEAAARHPDRIAAISLLAMSYPMPVGDPLMVPAAADEPVANDRLVAWSFGRAAGMGGNRVPGIWMTGAGLRVSTQAPDGTLHADLKACHDYDGGDDAAQAIACPVQFILAGADMMTPLKAGKAYATKFKAPRIDIVPGAGHNLMIEYPDETLDALKAFHGG